MERNSSRKTRIGIVVSDKMNKTVVVKIETVKKHSIYHKRIRVSKKFKAHDELNQCLAGDKIKIMEIRPLSKDKRFRVVEILEKGKRV